MHGVNGGFTFKACSVSTKRNGEKKMGEKKRTARGKSNQRFRVSKNTVVLSQERFERKKTVENIRGFSHGVSSQKVSSAATQSVPEGECCPVRFPLAVLFLSPFFFCQFFFVLTLYVLNRGKPCYSVHSPGFLLRM